MGWFKPREPMPQFSGEARFLQTYMGVRQVFIGGRMGGGKTLLAFALMMRLLKDGVIKGVISNVGHRLTMHPWREPWEEDGKPRCLVGAGLVFDEPWTELDNRTSMSNTNIYGAFGRKFESYWAYPSAIQLDSRQAQLTVRCGIVAVGRRQYEWSYAKGDDIIEEGKFWLKNPAALYGLYDTRAIPMDSMDIDRLMARTIFEHRREDATSPTEFFRAVSEDGTYSSIGDLPTVRKSRVRIQSVPQAS